MIDLIIFNVLYYQVLLYHTWYVYNGIRTFNGYIIIRNILLCVLEVYILIDSHVNYYRLCNELDNWYLSRKNMF